MIKIIKPGKKIFHMTCKNCGCEFTYELSDIRLSSVTCPDCYSFCAHLGPEQNRVEKTISDYDTDTETHNCRV